MNSSELEIHELPFELQSALTESVEAKRLFYLLEPSNQRRHIQWIMNAKKERTRLSRAKNFLTTLLEKID